MDGVMKIAMAELTRAPSPLLVWSSSSSEDEFEKEERAKHVKIENYLDTINKYSDEEFKSHFRLARGTALKLVDMYKPNVKPFRGGWRQVSAEQAVYLTIWYLANMETFRQLADRFNLTISCTYKTVNSVVKFLVKQSPKFIRWPTDEEAISDTQNFTRKQGLENVIGAVDGCHIRIIKPKKHAEDFVNRKGYHSVILQGIVNSKKMFIDISAGTPGSVHNARVLRKTKMYEKASQDYDGLFYGRYYLLGDSAYPALRWLKPPFKDNGYLNNEQREYNYKHSAARIVVEHTFGILKGRFRRLRGFDNLKQTFITNCILAACVLHNICLLNDDVVEEMFNDVDMDS